MNDSDRPNLLLITSDQQRGDCYGFAGRRVSTPHLDAFRRQGTWLKNAITPNVVCQPARASILTGQLPRTHGVHDNGIDLDAATGEKGFAGSLGRAEYDTAFFGKAHFASFLTFEPTGTPECLESSAGYGEDWYGPYMGFEHVELVLVGHNLFPPETPPKGQHYERWFHADGKGAEKIRLYAENARDTKGAAQTLHSRLPTAWHNSSWVADRSIGWLEQRRDRPFAAWVSFPDPHHPFDCPEPWSYLHRPEDVDLPEHRTRDLEHRPWWHRAVLEGKPTGSETHAAIRTGYSRIQPQTDDQLREIIANTYGMLSLIDHNVGRILNRLDELGIAENTVVIYTSDHGDWLGDHGLILKGPMHYEGLLRVGMIARGPGIRENATVEAPASTLDIASTFADYAGAQPRLSQHGTSLRGLLEGTDGSRDFAYNEWDLHSNRTGVSLDLRTVRTESEKLTVDLHSGTGEMYDLGNDPDEMENLYDDPAHKGLRDTLTDMIDSRPDDALGRREPVGMA